MARSVAYSFGISEPRSGYRFKMYQEVDVTGM